MYLYNLENELIANNAKALRFRDGKAWDNKKRNTRRLKAPRGPWFKRFEKMERLAAFNKQRAEIAKLLEQTSN